MSEKVKREPAVLGASKSLNAGNNSLLDKPSTSTGGPTVPSSRTRLGKALKSSGRLNLTASKPTSYGDDDSSDSCPTTQLPASGSAKSSGCSFENLDQETPQLRKKRRRTSCDSCPICGITVRCNELIDHYEQELRKLDKLQRKVKRNPKLATTIRQSSFKEVKANREKRLKGAKETRDASVNACIVRFPDDIYSMLPYFAQNSSILDVDDFDISDIALDEIQADVYISGIDHDVELLQNISGFPLDRIERTEEDDTVNVVDDDEEDKNFGPSQFTEHDLMPCQSTLDDENRSALREAVLSFSKYSTFSKNIQTDSKDFEELEVIVKVERTIDDQGTFRSCTGENSERNSSESIVVAALRSKIEELKQEVKNSAKCNICMESFQEPLVSVTCWHVSCKDCWMKTLGEKKLCPQCSRIVLPSNLRRIYM